MYTIYACASRDNRRLLDCYDDHLLTYYCEGHFDQHLLTARSSSVQRPINTRMGAQCNCACGTDTCVTTFNLAMSDSWTFSAAL